MPHVHVDLIGPRDSTYIAEVLAAVRAGVVKGLGAPDDRVTVRVAQIPADHVSLPPARTTAFTVVDVSLYEGRTREIKQACIDAVRAQLAEAPGIAPADVAIVFHDFAPADLDLPVP